MTSGDQLEVTRHRPGVHPRLPGLGEDGEARSPQGAADGEGRGGEGPLHPPARADLGARSPPWRRRSPCARRPPSAGPRSSITPAASAATPAAPPASPRTRSRSGSNRTYVKYVDVGRFPQARRAFQVTRCNQCAEPPCVEACPTAAMHQRPDGIVDFDKRVCIGCKACIAACPYDAIFINPEDQSAEKCNFCAHRLDVGLEPACVVVCPTEALLVGDLNDGTSRVSETVGRDVVTVRRPEKETQPKLFYKGAHQATLDPLAARRPKGGIFLWSEQGSVPHQVTSGHPGTPNNAAAAVLAYDVPHRAPWDWRVSLYTWTKGIAAGAWLVPGAPAAGRRPRPREPAVGLGGSRRGGRLPRRDRRAARGRPRPPRAFLPGPDPSPVEELARPGRGDHLRVRSRPRRCTSSASVLGASGDSAGPGVGGRAPGRAVRGLHRVALRPGQGPRPLAEPAPAADPPPAGPSRRRLRARPRRRARRARGGPRPPADSPRGRRFSTSCSSRAR